MKNGKVGTKFTKGNKTEKENTKKGKLAYAQYGERTKPSAMQIEGKSNNTHKDLNFALPILLRN